MLWIPTQIPEAKVGYLDSHLGVKNLRSCISVLVGNEILSCWKAKRIVRRAEEAEEGYEGNVSNKVSGQNFRCGRREAHPETKRAVTNRRPQKR